MAYTKVPANLLDTSAHVDLLDNEQIRLGSSQEFQLYHTGSGNSIISETGSGSLYLDGTNIYLRKSTSSGEALADFVGDGAVTLYHNGNPKLATSSSGITVTGDISGTTATASGGTSTTALASTAFVQQELTTLIGGAPSTLNDLNELAAAINDDANYNSTLTTALATKLPLAGGTLTGDLLIPGKIRHAGDTDTYIAFANNDDFRVVVGNSTRAAFNTSKIHFNQEGINQDFQVEGASVDNLLYVDASADKVGIGTDAPSALLHVKKDVDSFIMKVENDGNSPGTVGNSYTDASDGLWVDTRWNTATNTPFKVTSNSGTAPMMIIKGNGNVGIGDASPDTKLHVAGNVKIGSAASSSWSTSSHDAGGLDVFVGSGSKGLTVWDDNSQSAPRFIVLRAGNVGIGTPSPATNLHVSTTSSHSEIRVSSSASSNSTVPAVSLNNTAVEWGMGILADNHLHFRENTASYTSRLTIADGGNVGIGTTNPTSGLHVSKAPNGNNPTTHILQSGATNAPTLTIQQSGNGGNPNVTQGLLIEIDGTNDGSSNLIKAIGKNSNVSGNDVNAFVVKNGGNVGIGTASPDNILHIKTTASGGPQIHLDTGTGSAFMNFDGTNLQISTQRDMVDGTWHDTSKSWGGININGTTSGSNITFSTADNNNTPPTTRMTIDGSGQLTLRHASHGLGFNYVGSTLPSIAGLFTSSIGLTETAYGDLNIKARTDYGGYYGIGFFTSVTNSTPRKAMAITSSAVLEHHPSTGAGLRIHKVLPRVTPNYPTAGQVGTFENWYMPPRGESGIIHYGNTNNSGGEYRCAGFIVYSAAEANNTPVAITISVTESINGYMVDFDVSAGYIRVKNTYGYGIELMGYIEAFNRE